MGEAKPASADGFRVEHDSMGEVRVPADARWGAQTQRAVENFPISGQPVARAILEALAIIKGTCAEVNAELGTVDATVAAAIGEAAGEVASGRHADQFPIDVFQTGSGTSTNMNMNEVLAQLAGERLGRPVSPNDEVNASQSSNDTFPAAIHLATVREIGADLVPALDQLAAALRRKGGEFAELVKAGRTHLMDATPVTLGQEFDGYAAAIEHGIERLGSSLGRVGELPLGGTAVGTGLNAKPGFAAEVIERKELTGPPRPLGKERWAGGIDAVGSTTLANVLSMTRYGGAVAACGLAGGMDLPTTVAPFILRGVSLLGVDSVMCPLPLRQQAWRRLEADLDRAKIAAMTSEIGLADVIDAGARILAGEVRGRIVVKIR